MITAAAFASGSGSNFQSLVDCQAKGASWRIRLLVSDREGAGALDRAQREGIPTRIIPVKGRDLEEVGRETLEALEDVGAQVVFLAGYLRLVPPVVVQAFPRRILNIHPALLPAFGGKGMWGRHVHEAVLASGARVSGPTVHFVDEQYDEGSIFAQWPVPVLEGDDASTLAARVLAVEHRIYPLAAEHLCRAVADGQPTTGLSLEGTTFSLSADEAEAGIERRFRQAFHDPQHAETT